MHSERDVFHRHFGLLPVLGQELGCFNRAAAVAAAHHLQACSSSREPVLSFYGLTLCIFATSGFHLALDGDQNLLQHQCTLSRILLDI